MKVKYIATGTMFIAIILMLVPAISAVEVNTVQTTNKAKLLDQLRSMSPQDLKDFIKEKIKTDAGNDGLLTLLLTLALPLLSAVIFVVYFLLAVLI